MSVAVKILSNTVFQMFGRLSVALLGAVTVKILTTYLTEAQYGAYSGITDYLAMIAIIADFGLFTIGVREMANDEANIPRIFNNILGIRLALGTFIMLFACVSAFFIFSGDDELVYGIAISSISTFLALSQGTIASILQVRLKMQYASFFQVLGKFFQVGYIVLVAFLLFADNSAAGFYQLLVAGIIANFVMLLGTSFFASREIKIRPRFEFDFWKNICKKALPYGFALALATIYLRVDSFMLLKMVGKEEVAYYSVAVKILETFRIFPLYFANSALPALTASLKKKDGRHGKIIQHSLEFMLALSLPVLVGGFLLAYNIIALVSTPEYLSNPAIGFYGSDLALQILLFEVVFSFTNAIFVFTLIAMGLQARIIWINAGAAALNVLLNFLLIPSMGFVGAGITTVFSEAFVLVFAYWMVKKTLKIKIAKTNAFKILLSALVMGVVVYGTKIPLEMWTQKKSLILGLLIPLGALTYGVMLFATKAVSLDKLRELKSKSQENVIEPS
jgi:O-antigen/teichoic acid export membrane protein